MADRTIYINSDTGRRVNLAGAVDITAVELEYEANEEWTYIFRNNSLVATDLSDSVTFSAALAADLTVATDPWIRILNANIDSTQSALGILVITMDSDYQAFREGTDGLRFKQTFFKLRGFNASDKEEMSFMLPVTAIGNVDATGGSPATNDLYYTKIQSDAKYATLQSTAVEDNIATFDSGGDVQDSSLALADVTTLIASVAATETSCTDDAATPIALGAAATYRVFDVVFTIDDSTNYIKYRYTVGHNGTSTENDGGDSMVIAGSLISGVTITFQLTAGTIYLVVTLSGVGQAVKCVSKISDKLPIST